MKNANTSLNNLSAARGELKGEINLHWDAIQNANKYIIEISGSSKKKIRWTVFDIISDSFYKIRNLKSNREYLFRVSALIQDREQIKSKVINKIAP